MDVEEALTAYLLGQTGLTALITRRFFFDELPQNTPLPAVVCIGISNVPIHTLNGQSNLERPVKQFTVYAATKAGAVAVATQIKAALNDYHGTLSGVVVQKTELQSEMSSLETSADGTVRVYAHDLEYEITYERM